MKFFVVLLLALVAFVAVADAGFLGRMFGRGGKEKIIKKEEVKSHTI